MQAFLLSDYIFNKKNDKYWILFIYPHSYHANNHLEHEVVHKNLLDSGP